MYRIEKQDLSSIFGFITIGLMLGHIGPLLSAASVDLGLEAGVVGQTIAIYYGISILGILAGFSLVKRFGKEWFVLLGSVLLILGYLMGLGIQSSLGLFLVTVVLGLGLGAYQIGVNSLAVERTSKLPESRQSGRLAYMQFFFGIGAVSGSAVSGLQSFALQQLALFFSFDSGIGTCCDICCAVFGFAASEPKKCEGSGFK